MDLQLNGKTALVTGASIGIGRGIALALGREGVRLALVARRANLLIRDMRSVSPHSLRISVGSPEQNDRLLRSLA